MVVGGVGVVRFTLAERVELFVLVAAAVVWIDVEVNLVHAAEFNGVHWEGVWVDVLRKH